MLAEALRALACIATAGRPLPPAAALTYPAHWRGPAVEALRRALRRVPEWASDEPLLIPDTAAALTALQADPGLPTRGVIALCDFGGSGTSITFTDAGTNAPIGATLRHLDFSGDLIDQALLAHVVAELSAGGSVDITSTSAIGSLTHLRAECGAAKERLSSASVTALPAELRGFRGDVRLTRTELDDVIARSLADVVAALHDAMGRAGVRPADLAAIASVGGGAAIPAVTTALSEHLRVPVVTTPRPALTAAIGAALRASRGPADDSATALAPAAAVAPVVAAPFAEPALPTGRALAWSEADDVPELAPALGGHAGRQPDRDTMTGAGPLLEFDPEPAPATDSAPPWYRRPMPVVVAALLVILLAGAGTVVALQSDSNAAPAAPAPSITTTPQAAPPPEVPSDAPSASLQNQAVQDEAPAQPRTVVQAPPTVVQTQVVQAPPVTSEAPPPPPVTETVTAPPVTETATVAPPSTAQPAPLIPTIPPIPTIPGLPQFFPQR